MSKLMRKPEQGVVGRRPILALALAGLLALPATLQPARAGEVYELGAQDRVRVTVVEWFTGTGELRSPVNGDYVIGPTGSISLPLIGEVPAAGLAPTALAEAVAERIRTKLALSERPLASVEIVQFRPFFVIGDVDHPGLFPYQPGLNAMRALAVAGGTTKVAPQAVAQAGREAARASGDRRNAMTRTVELQARRARLEAELLDAKAVTFPAELLKREDDLHVASTMLLEETLFESRKRAFKNSVEAQVRLVALYEQEMNALQVQGEALKRHEDATQRQADSLRSLQSRGLATMGREFDIDRLIAEVAVRQQDVAGRQIRLQQDKVRAEDAMRQSEMRRRQDIANELQTVQTAIDEMDQRLIMADAAVNAAELSTGRVERPSFTILRQDPASGADTEIPATAATFVKPGDVLVVQLGNRRPVTLSSAGAIDGSGVKRQ